MRISSGCHKFGGYKSRAHIPVRKKIFPKEMATVKRTLIAIACSTCSKEFSTYRCLIKNTRRKFCSLRCAHLGNKKFAVPQDIPLRKIQDVDIDPAEDDRSDFLGACRMILNEIDQTY